MSGDADRELLKSLRAHARGWRGRRGLQLFVGDGWLPIVRACHETVEATFPDYELHAVKEKYGELAFQAFPAPWRRADPASSWSDEDAELLEEIIEPFVEQSARTCERCGEPGELRAGRRHWLTLCAACDEVVPDPRGGATGRRFLSF